MLPLPAHREATLPDVVSKILTACESSAVETCAKRFDEGSGEKAESSAEEELPEMASLVPFVTPLLWLSVDEDFGRVDAGFVFCFDLSLAMME